MESPGQRHGICSLNGSHVLPRHRSHRRHALLFEDYYLQRYGKRSTFIPYGARSWESGDHRGPGERLGAEAMAVTFCST